MYPSPLVLPKGLNPHAVNQWFEACKNLPKDARSAWRTARLRYAALCDHAGLLPFADVPRDVAIRAYLGQRRRLFVRYMDYTHILAQVKIRMVKRQVRIEPSGFKITVEAWVRVQDPTWFKIPGTRWRFTRGWDKQHRYTCQVDPGLVIYIRNPAIRSPGFWYVGYIITCPIAPDQLTGSVTDQQNYVLHNLWDPISHVWRARGLDRVRAV